MVDMKEETERQRDGETKCAVFGFRHFVCSSLCLFVS